MIVMVTGGTGFVGSHVVVALASAGHRVVIVDDGSNSEVVGVVDRLTKLLGYRPIAERVDVRITDALVGAIERNGVDAVVHLAAMKDLRESVRRPLDYYRNNVLGLRSVLAACEQTGVERFVFSSSGSVYGDTGSLPIDERTPLRPTNPYSASKVIGERMLERWCRADPARTVLSLRYFNPAGAHPSAMIGESSTRRATTILPVLLDTAAGNRPAVDVFGNDFDTVDGTGVRDYVHVMDVAEAHVAALHRLGHQPGFDAVNVGRGHGVSVLELIEAVENVTGEAVRFEIKPRRAGDVDALVGCTRRASDLLGLGPGRDVTEMVCDAWRWHQANAVRGQDAGRPSQRNTCAVAAQPNLRAAPPKTALVSPARW